MRKNKVVRRLSIGLTILLLVMTIPAAASAAEAPVFMGNARSFAVLAGSTITNTGPTTIDGSAGGNIGVSPGTAITGFPPGLVSGTIHQADETAELAKTDLVIAYNDAASREVTENLTDQDLGGLTLTPGVYKFDTSAQLTGTLILDAEGDPEAVFIFQIGSTLTTASDSTVSLTNGASNCRVFWQVGSSATLGTNTEFVGHVFALTSITAETGATVWGQLLARNGAVTLDSNEISNDYCSAEPSPTPTTDETTAETTAASTDTEVTEDETIADETSDTAETTSETVAADETAEDEIPKTGEAANTMNSLIIGLILLGLAAGIPYYLRRRWLKK